MRAQISKIVGINTPSDGFTAEEQQLSRLIGEQAVATLYHKLPTSRMKALVAMHHELGYKQELLAEIFGVSQERINQELMLIRKYFLQKPDRSVHNRPYVPREKPPTIKIADLLRVVMLFKER